MRIYIVIVRIPIGGNLIRYKVKFWINAVCVFWHEVLHQSGWMYPNPNVFGEHIKSPERGGFVNTLLTISEYLGETLC